MLLPTVDQEEESPVAQGYIDVNFFTLQIGVIPAPLVGFAYSGTINTCWSTK